MKRILLLSVFPVLLLIGFSPANAATCFWVGGSGTWDTTNTGGGGTGGIKWATATGGSTTCAATGNVPNNNGDTATIDANSGNGTITVNTNINTGTGVALQMTGGTSTLDFSINNNSPTFSNFTVTAGTIKLGSGTFTVPAACSNGSTLVNFTGATVTAGTSTIALTGSGSAIGDNIFNGGGKTFATVTITGASNPKCMWSIAGANTFGHLTLTGPLSLLLNSGNLTQTVSNAYTWTGTAANPISLFNSTNNTETISTPAGSTGTWISISNVTFSSNVPVFSNCITSGGLTGATCNTPSVVAGSGSIIGG